MAMVAERFGERVKRQMEQKGLSSREVWRRAVSNKQALSEGLKISVSTVQSAGHGIVPGPEIVVALALALEDEPNRLLRLAGYPFKYDTSVLREGETAESDRRTLAAA